MVKLYIDEIIVDEVCSIARAPELVLYNIEMICLMKKITPENIFDKLEVLIFPVGRYVCCLTSSEDLQSHDLVFYDFLNASFTTFEYVLSSLTTDRLRRVFITTVSEVLDNYAVRFPQVELILGAAPNEKNN
jgi:hypothetical protein